jgi:hypothetical protein
MKKGEYVCERFFKVGFGGTENVVSDPLVHRNPEKVEDVYDFDAKPCAFSFSSPYVLRRLLTLNNMLVTEARNKYNASTFCGDEVGN